MPISFAMQAKTQTENDVDLRVRRRLRELRIQRGLTLEQLAEKAEISKSFLWDVERGSDISGERLTLLNLIKIADGPSL
jgi:transcriptional regulator with XRE-family HTH domain